MSLVRNTAHNLVGFLVPSLLALATVPAYLALIGAQRYGVMMLAWLVLGFSGLFDLGLGRAASQRIASSVEASGETSGKSGTAAAILVTALAANLVIGGILILLIVPLFGWFLSSGMAMPPGLRAEALECLPLLGMALPVASTIGVLSGALSGRQRFAELNRITVIASALFQLAPLAAAWFIGPQLLPVIAAGLLARLAAMALLWHACRREFGSLRPALWQRRQLGELLRFGSWVTLGSLAAPLLAFADRFIIGALLGVRAVTVYAIPWDATQRLGGFPGALGSALFPRLAAADSAEAARLADMAVRVLFIAMTPIVAAGMFICDPLFRLWLGPDIGAEAAPLARILLVAIWFSAFAQMAFVRLQAQGRPEVIGKLHVLEIPLHAALIWFATTHFGLIGAALAIVLRLVLDGLLLFWLAGRRMELAWLILPFLALFTALALVLGPLALSPLQSLTGGALALALCALPCWKALPGGSLAAARAALGLDLRRADAKTQHVSDSEKIGLG